jgi:hypothetical protein
VTPRRSLVCLVALVVAASVAATAHGLYAVALASGVPWQVACLYPLITDGLALVAYWATKQLVSTFYPWLVVVVAAGLSGLAQAVNLAGLGESPTWLRFGVGYWPAVAALLAAHLLWLVWRPRGLVTARVVGEVREEVSAGGSGRPLEPGPGPSAPDLPALAASNGGKPKAPSWEEFKREQQERWAREDAGLVPGIPPARTAASNGNGHAVTLKQRAEDEALRYLEDHGVLPSENVLAGLAQCSRGTARNALVPLRKG